jgi:predicted HicB family RNase H-like nuclease
MGIKALIGFEGATVAELEKDFNAGVDDYLELSKQSSSISVT